MAYPFSYMAGGFDESFLRLSANTADLETGARDDTGEVRLIENPAPLSRSLPRNATVARNARENISRS